ncbi:SDR family oxidoreductase [Micromonospora radicis]|uniref:SDR family oxidoreductase n=1 Tax=Micromonospora radicis TaxID=1894971 RepID=A0A418MWE3_9ACTN|nr:SDR family oxidoreductase [Micromonospora radicis]RIV39205.1 SDR family oxidoreductase [Micromonospora radicis]
MTPGPRPRTTLVTGSASGIGAATAHAVRAAGHTVIGLDRDGADIRADLATPNGRLAALGELAGTRLDAVIACAGLRAPTPDTVSVNYFGVVDLLTGLRPLLLDSPAPRVAVISSVASILAVDDAIVSACRDGDEPRARREASAVRVNPDGRPMVYASSKAALAAWVRRTAPTHGWGGSGILLNAVAPGTIATPMMSDLTGSPELLEDWLRRLPNTADRLGQPEEIAALLTWLTGVENSMLTGQVIFADLGTEAMLRGDTLW